MNLGNLALSSILFDYSASLPPLGHQKESGKDRGSLFPGTQPPAPVPPRRHPSQSLRGPIPGRTWAPSTHSASPRAQGMTQVAFPTSPSLLAFLPAQPLHPQSPAPLVTPSSPHSAACKTSCLLQATQEPGRRATAPRPGSFPATWKGKFSADPRGQEWGSASPDTRDT